MNNNITLHFACLSRFPRLCALAVMHLLVLIPLVLPADTFGPYTYTITDGQATITSFDRTYSGTLSITNKLGGYPVTSIGDYAFSSCYSLASVTISGGVTSIGAWLSLDVPLSPPLPFLLASPTSANRPSLPVLPSPPLPSPIASLPSATTLSETALPSSL